MSITVSQLIAVSEAFNSALSGWTASGLDLTNLSQDAVLGEDILSIVAVFWPPATVLADALAICAALAEAGVIKPDPDPIHDAQTTETPHSGRNA